MYILEGIVETHL